MAEHSDIITQLQHRFEEISESEFRGQTRVVVRQDQCFAVLEYLHQQHGFDMLSDVTCVDYLNYRDATDRFGLAYLLVNTWWIRRSLRCPPPRLQEVLGPQTP